MCKKKLFFFGLLSALVMIVILAAAGIGSSRVYAQAPTPLPDSGSCDGCHEDLYFRYDTGKWFCIKESPMQCICCHGGDPDAITKAAAHANLKVYPILAGDISTCQKCHLEQGSRHAADFDRLAGISDVRVAVPYQPVPTHGSERSVVSTSETQSAEFPVWVSALEILALALITGLALAVYAFHRLHQHQTNKTEQKK